MAKSQIRQYVFTPSTNTSAPFNGTIKIPGKYDLSQLLLITNSTKNAIIYNFADSTYSGTTISFSRTNDAVNFPTALDNSDGVTTITLTSVDTQFATTGMLASDQLQILYEKPYMDVRMPEIGTDAFERTRVSNPQSMLDADFEYGLQPTKWLTYDLMRGYPSIYEVPGTDQTVLSVVTDASAGTGGVGESLITVTISGVFGSAWVVGGPITIKGYLNTVSGFSRAEGTFLINSISSSTLTYYAKAKVGTNNGDVLSTIYTQLRQGGFYTGAQIGTPTFTYGNPPTPGSSSSATIATATTTFTGTISAGTTALTTSGGTPTAGMVLSGGNIVAGTYIVSGSGTSWVVSTIQTITTTSTTLTATTNTLTAGGTSSGLAVGQVISGAGILTGTTIISVTSPFTGAGGNGTYAVNNAQTVASPVAITGSTGLGTITITFATNHGFVPGDTIITQILSDTLGNNHAVAQGPFFVETVPSLTSLTYTARSSNIITGTITGLVYARPDAFYQHRPFDGGVILGTGSPSHGSMAVRMSKKYIRYQSGKAINYNTGALFAPNYDIRSVVASGTVATAITQATNGTTTLSSTQITLAVGGNLASVLQNMIVTGTGIPVGTYVVNISSTTLTLNQATIAVINTATNLTFTPSILIGTDDIDHGCQAGAVVIINGVTTSGFNGTYTVGAIVDERILIVPVIGTLGATTGAIGTPCILSIYQWNGSTVRAGTFDEQNGTFWQYDGQIIAIGRRSSTFQLAGTVSITPDSNSVVGANSRYTSQLIAGDRVVIKGMTHVISQVVSDTQLYITPDYRGATSGSGVKMVKIQDYIIPQSKWNTDRCDGSGNVYNPSGYNIDISKMQMIGLQWTWYGAGFTDWMMRGPDGKYITVHRLRGNNINKEAYMRSGNQPVRYEIVNESARTSLTSAALAGDTSLTVVDTSFFPTTGTVYVDNEIIAYTGKTLTTLTGCTRSAPLTQFNAGLTRSFTAGVAAGHAISTGVILIGQTATPSISHWGSAFLTDGGFDQDRGYIFNYQATNVAINTKKTTAFAIRLAPSVSNAIIGDLGVRELINRAQLLLQSIEITAGGTTNSNSALVIEAILNPSNYPVNVANISWNSLSSTALPTGQPSFSQIANGTSITFQGSASNTTSNTLAAYVNTNYNSVTVLPIASIVGVQVGDDVYVPSAPAAIYGATKITSIISNATFTATLPTSVSAGVTASASTGTISGTTFTPSGTLGGTFITGMVLTGTSVVSNTFIIGPGTTAGTYFVNQGQTVTATAITGTPYVLTVSALTTGTVVPSQALSGGTVTAGTGIIAYGTGTGGNGTYYISQSYTGSPTGASVAVNAVVFNNPVPTPWFNGTAVQFSRNTYALPGETVFSFISSPSNKDSLDLTPFKELTNTPIGGRGTFPNGPDVLFINVYLTQGSPVLANLVLRWGEAQA